MTFQKYCSRILIIFITVILLMHSTTNAVIVPSWENKQSIQYETNNFNELYSIIEDLGNEYEDLLEEYGSLERTIEELKEELNQREEEISNLKEENSNNLSNSKFDMLIMLIIIIALFIFYAIKKKD